MSPRYAPNGTGAEVVEFASGAPTLTRAQLCVQIEAWTTAAKARRNEVAIDRDSLGGIERVHAHRKAEIDGLARYYRLHKGADAAPGVFSVIVVMSDNDEYGACYLSISRIAELLSRTTDCITDALHRLANAGIIGVQERYPSTPLRWPLLPPPLADESMSIHDLVEVYSPARKIGRPAKNPSPRAWEGVSGKPLPPQNPPGFKTPPPARPKPLPPRTPPEDPNRDTPKTLLGADAPERVDESGGGRGRKRPSWAPRPAEIETGFAEWWEHYPRKEDKGDARRAYTKCLIHKDPKERATIPQLLAAVKGCRFPTERRYIKLPATWLNKGAWQNVSAAPAVAPPADLDDRTGALHAALEARVGAAIYGAWFTSLRVEDLDGDRLTVSTTTAFLKTRIAQEYQPALADAATLAFGTTVQWVEVTERRASP